MKTHFPSFFHLSAAPCAFARGVMSEAFSIDEGGVTKVFNKMAAGTFFEELAQQASPATGGAPFPLQGMGQIARGGAALTFGGAGQGREATGAEKAAREPRWETISNIFVTKAGFRAFKSAEECKFQHYEKALELCLNDEGCVYDINEGKCKHNKQNLKVYVEHEHVAFKKRDTIGCGIPMTAPPLPPPEAAVPRFSVCFVPLASLRFARALYSR